METISSAAATTLPATLLLSIFEVDQSVGTWIKLSLVSRKAFLTFKNYSKEGKVRHLSHRDHGDGVSDHFVRRICARRIGKNLESLDFEFSAVTDEHVIRSVLPKTLRGFNLNACREISELTLVQISE